MIRPPPRVAELAVAAHRAIVEDGDLDAVHAARFAEDKLEVVVVGVDIEFRYFQIMGPGKLLVAENGVGHFFHFRLRLGHAGAGARFAYRSTHRPGEERDHAHHHQEFHKCKCAFHSIMSGQEVTSSYVYLRPSGPHEVIPIV